MKMDELLTVANGLASRVAEEINPLQPAAVLLAAILIELREARAKAENRDEEG